MSTKTWAKKLFAPRFARPAAPAKPARRASARLGVERLDDRPTPSATAVLNNHVLTVTAQGSTWNSPDQIVVSPTYIDSNVDVSVNYRTVAEYAQGNPETRIDRVVFQGVDHVNAFTTGADTFRNPTALDGEYHVGHGIPSGTNVYGGRGTNSLHANDGMNALYGGGVPTSFTTPPTTAAWPSPAAARTSSSAAASTRTGCWMSRRPTSGTGRSWRPG